MKKIIIRKIKFQKYLFFYTKSVKQNNWLFKPRFFAFINLFFISLWRDNCFFGLGLGLGKHHIQIGYKH